MKKMIICVLLFATAILSFGQTSESVKIKNQEIVDLLNMSAEFNGGLTIEDLNHPWMLKVGQTATYQLQDGSKLQFVAEKGDNFWNLGKKALRYQMENPNNPIVDPNKKPVLNPTDPDENNAGVPPVIQKTWFDKNYPWLFPLLLILACCVMYLLFYKKKKVKAEQQQSEEIPTVQLAPVVPGGVSDANAPRHMQETFDRVQNLFRPEGETEKGIANTVEGKEVQVTYANGLTRKEPLKNKECFRRKAIPLAGQEGSYHGYFIQPCGNDFGVVNDQDIIWTPLPISAELQQANQQILTSVTQQSQEAAKAEQSVLPLTGSSIMDVLKDTASKMMEKDSGKLSFKTKEVTFEVEFSKGILAPSNGQQKKEVTEVASATPAN